MTVTLIHTDPSTYNATTGWTRNDRTFGRFGTTTANVQLRYKGVALNSRNHGYALGVVGSDSLYNDDKGRVAQGPHAYLFAVANVISDPPQARVTTIDVEAGDLLVDHEANLVLRVVAPTSRWQEPTLEITSHATFVRTEDRSAEVAAINAERVGRAPLSEAYLSM